MTLTETAFYTRLTIKYGTLFIILLIIARLSWNVGLSLYRTVFPPPPPAPTVAFGRLPVLALPTQNPRNHTFVLQTPEGDLPKLPLTIPVYFMPPENSSLLGLDEATKIARKLGFTGKIVRINDTIYRFESDRVPSSIDINIINKTFSVNYNLNESRDLLSLHPKSTEEAIRATKGFLSSSSILPTDVANGQVTADFIKVQASSLVETISLSEANFIRVNLFRQNYNDLPVLTPTKKRGNIWFLVSGENSGEKQIIGGEYHYFAVDGSRSSTYPIKTAQSAWDELTGGKAFILQSPREGNVTVRRVYLAYYDSGRPQGFLQPIVVFEGDDQFLAYLPAVTDAYYGSEKPSPAPIPTEAPKE